MHQLFWSAQQITQQPGDPHFSSQLRKTMHSHTLWFYELQLRNKSRYRSNEVNVFDLHSGLQKAIAVLFENF